MSRRTLLGLGGVALALAWTLAGSRQAFLGHMLAHMGTVAVAAPLLALGVRGRVVDPATAWPAIVVPLPMSLVELVVVWGWHAPAARGFAEASAAGMALEQASFLAAGLLLWSACLADRGAGVVALLLTSMHMTLLGALIALTPRPLYETATLSCFGIPLPPLVDQQAGGVVMLLAGAAAYLAGGLALLGGVLRTRAAAR